MSYPHYGQVSPNSCGIECMRMALETLLGAPVQRTWVKSRLEDVGAYWQGTRAIPGGALFDVMDRALYPEGRGRSPVTAVLRTSLGPNDLVAAVRGGNSVALVECRNNSGQPHCIVVDLSVVQGNQHHFQVRDPAQQNLEPAVPDTDPRIAGQHRYWLLSS
jgi:hypothetical protein